MKFKRLIICALLLFGCLGISAINKVHADTQPVAYDISQWQGHLSQSQAAGLKHETKFMILRTQAGDIKDSQIDNNQDLMRRNHIPYGVYSYSYYTSPSHAAGEANELYQRSPQANFYVNDDEHDYTNGTSDQSTQSWASEMHRLTRRPVVLYSDLSYMNSLSPQTRSMYNALWVADYSYQPDPSYHYDLWQNSRTHYSPALGQDVDSDSLPYGARSVNYWTRSRYVRRRYRPRIRRPKVRHPIVRHSYPKRNQGYKKSVIKRDLQNIRRERDQSQVFLHLVNAVRRYPSLDFRQKAYVGTLWDWLCRDRALAFKLMDCSNQYYCSPKVSYLRVTQKRGTYAHDFYDDPKSIAKIPYNTKLRVAYFRYTFFRGNEITRAVAKYHGQWITFTSNKKYVRA